MVALYKQINQLLQSPDAVTFPTRFGLYADLFADYWVGQSFNSYVLNGVESIRPLENL